MKVTIVFQNVQGLNDPLKDDIVRRYFKPLFRDISILFLHEHHLRRSKPDNLKQTFWPQATFLGYEAALGFGDNNGE